MNTMKASGHSSLSPSSSSPSSFYVQIPPTIPEKNDCFGFGLVLIRVSSYELHHRSFSLIPYIFRAFFLYYVVVVIGNTNVDV